MFELFCIPINNKKNKQVLKVNEWIIFFNIRDIINNNLIPKEQKGKVHVFKRLTLQDNKTMEIISNKIRISSNLHQF